MLNQIVIFSVEYLYLFIAVIAIGFAMFGEIQTQRRSIVLLTLLSSTVGFLLDKLLNALINNPRPFVIENVTPLIPHVANNGFPSEHTLFAMMIAGVIFVYHKKMGIFLGVLAIVVGISSVLAKVHHVTDVIGSIFIAVTAILIGRYILTRFNPKESTT